MGQKSGFVGQSLYICPTDFLNCLNFSKFNSLYSVATYFNTEEKCQRAIVESRWSDGDIICPYCGQHHCHKRAG
ncbi:MAG: transposase [Bacteroidales bacterium]|nr:transposase [Bacteroidales bacterium]